MITLIIHHTIQLFTTLGKALENMVRKGERADNHHFHLFLECFFPYQRQSFSRLAALNLLSATVLRFDHCKILWYGQVWNQAPYSSTIR